MASGATDTPSPRPNTLSRVTSRRWRRGGRVATPSEREPRITRSLSTQDPKQFEDERAYIEETFTPLVERCKELGRAIRIGTNHGSLSARIMSFYGDSAQGMVESALEFANICRKLDFHNFVFSMKASNPVVMVQAYRLLAATQYE